MTIRAFDMSRYWRLVEVEGGRVTGTFWVSVGTERHPAAIVRPVDVTVWLDDQHIGGRILYSGDITATVENGEVELPDRSIRERVRFDVLDAREDMAAAILAAVAEAQKATAPTEAGEP